MLNCLAVLSNHNAISSMPLSSSFWPFAITLISQILWQHPFVTINSSSFPVYLCFQHCQRYTDFKCNPWPTVLARNEASLTTNFQVVYTQQCHLAIFFRNCQTKLSLNVHLTTEAKTANHSATSSSSSDPYAARLNYCWLKSLFFQLPDSPLAT